MAIISKSFYIKNAGHRILRMIRRCKICQYAKNRYLHGISKAIIPKDVNEMIAIDYLGPLPKGLGNVQHVFVIIDTFSKFIKLHPVRNPTTKNSIDKLREYISKFGKPKKILTDFGAAFTSQNWKKWMTEQNMEHVLIPVRHPQVNLAERVNKEVGRLLRTYCHASQTTC